MNSFNALKKIYSRRAEIKNLPHIKVAVVGDTATQFLAMAIYGTGVERGFDIELFEAEYNQVERQFLDKASDLYRFDADYIVVFQSTHKLLTRYGKCGDADRLRLADERLDFVRTICETTDAKIIYCNYPEIDDAVFGNFANQVEFSFLYQLRKLNYKLMEVARECPNLYICDLATIQNKLGRDTVFQPSIYVSTEMVLSIEALPWVASRILDIICALKGKIKKCLVLDLDNTLWGGVIGDDGIENIQIGHGLGIGKAFSEFQLWIKKLKERGVILAVCSKNTESVAKEPFIEHPDMILKLDDIAVFVANWENKADNIRRIQQILNIGFDSMVFLDDNPFERNMVRANIPDIVVPELPEDPGEYLEYLYGLNLFETVSYSAADSERTRQYQVEARRVSERMSFANEDEFLASLEMVSDIQAFTPFNIPRVAQLSQRSNQFNLRTVRYTEGDIERMGKDSERYAPFTFTLADKFGDNGLICVVILEKDNRAKTLFIDTWFMSCRVLKRGMERFTLNVLVRYARDNGFKKIIGEYIPTAKNKMVEDHYAQLGFVKLPEMEKNLYMLDVDSYIDKTCYILPK